jgi:eukaryotic-like serine/threonine-protein kinase
VKACPSCSLHNDDLADFCIRCGLSLSNVTPTRAQAGTEPGPPPLLPGAHLSAGVVVDAKYRIVRVLGEGGMGIVYLAHDVHTDTPVALKSIRSEFADAPEYRTRILAEGRALARIDHPNVVRLNAVVVEPSALYLVMQYIEGDTLEAIIKKHAVARAPIAVFEALRIFRMVAEGVEAAHVEGVIHRDLKPANILLRRRDGVVKVTDFGIAKWEEDAKAGRGVTRGIIGSIFYMAPEQISGRRDIDKRVDVYALGILLFEILTGHVPFDAPSDFEVMKLHAQAPLPSVQELRPELPPGLDEVLLRACAKDRDRRFATCRELLDALDAVANRRRAAPRALAWTAIGTLAAAALGAAVVLLHGAGGDAEPAATPSASAVPAAESAGSPVASPLSRLAGRWRSDSGRTYDAVVQGDAVEFRILRAAEFPRQGYLDGEPRFRLSPLPDRADAFAVEDDLRPTPPEGLEYDLSARDSCRAAFTEIGGKKLLAAYDTPQQKLVVALVQLTTGPERFQSSSGRILGCTGLGSAKAKPIESLLVRISE